MEAAIRYDYCMLRYSNRSILSVRESSVFVYLQNTESATDPISFNQTLSNLLFELIQRAASGGSLRKFATGNVDANFQPIYALVQCTPDLSQQDCTTCLETSFQQIPQCCAGKRGGRVITTSCILHFEMEPFYNVSAGAPPSSPSPPPPSNETTNSTGKTPIFYFKSVRSIHPPYLCLLFCLFSMSQIVFFFFNSGLN